jgi:hypothetical protein
MEVRPIKESRVPRRSRLPECVGAAVPPPPVRGPLGLGIVVGVCCLGAVEMTTGAVVVVGGVVVVVVVVEVVVGGSVTGGGGGSVVVAQG